MTANLRQQGKIAVWILSIGNKDRRDFLPTLSTDVNEKSLWFEALTLTFQC